MNNLHLLKAPFGAQLENCVITISVEHLSYWTFWLLYRFFSKTLNKKIKIINNSLPILEVQNSLNFLFLGEYNIYFLDVTELDFGDTKKWITFLENYNGPHKIIFLALNNHLLSSKLLKINLESEIDVETAKNLSHTLSNSNLNLSYLNNKKLLLSDIFVLIVYNMILPKQEESNFFSEWSDSLLSPNRPLYILSQYLFSRQSTNFFNYWEKIKHIYTQEQWLSYWSDQIYQAIIFLENLKIDFATAKLSSKKLPFSFINTDYNNFTQEYLAELHNDLYLLDYNKKVNSSYTDLTYFYHKFFNKKK